MLGLLWTRQIGQRVDGSLKDMGRRQGIDLLGTLGAAHVGINHCALNGLRRPALIPQEQWQLERRQGFARMPARIGSEGCRSRPYSTANQ